MYLLLAPKGENSMGQKVNPISYRLQVSKNWSSKWFSRGKSYRKWLIEDDKIRKTIEERYKARPTIARVNIERSPNLTTIVIQTAKAGAVIGKQGSGINELKRQIEKITGGPIRINVEEVNKPELSAKLVAENIGFQLGKRMNFRRAVKMASGSTMNAGAKGVRIEVAGRLNGAEMSRREKFIEGSVPLHTLRADIDFHVHHAQTVAGVIGVKVWIYKGDK
jgi:small subunit ribosomal protein S3